jgi:RNA polymerase sigma factor (sigma-70 family)
VENQLRETAVSTVWDDLGRFRPRDVPLLFPIARRYSWKVVWELGLPVHEQEDIMQELLLAVWQRLERFDPGRGGCLPFLRCVIANEAKKIEEYRRAACRDYRRCVTLNECSAVATRPGDRENRLILRIDISRFVSSLPLKLRLVALELMRAKPGEVVLRQRISRDTVHQRIRQMRSRLERWRIR